MAHTGRENEDAGATHCPSLPAGRCHPAGTASPDRSRSLSLSVCANSARPMSENTINAALRRLGYSKEEMTGHGFRSMASTLLNEMGWNRDAIERQLAHAERNSIRAAYNFAEFLPERRKMMQAWADYLDKLKAGAKVTLLQTTLG